MRASEVHQPSRLENSDRIETIAMSTVRTRHCKHWAFISTRELEQVPRLYRSPWYRACTSRTTETTPRDVLNNTSGIKSRSIFDGFTTAREFARSNALICRQLSLALEYRKNSRFKTIEGQPPTAVSQHTQDRMKPRVALQTSYFRVLMFYLSHLRTWTKTLFIRRATCTKRSRRHGS